MSKTVAIFCAGQWGDCATISSVLRYRKELWGDCKIVWYIAESNMDLLKYQDVELRPFPRGFGYPEMVIEENKKLIAAGKEPLWEDWQPLVDENNHLNLELKKSYPSLNDIDEGYFPAPHQMLATKRHGYSYPEISKKVFSVPDDWEWHPVLNFSRGEELMADEFLSKMDSGRKILIESFAGSGQSKLDAEMIEMSMNLCKQYWGDCNFIFASHKFLRDTEKFPEYLFEQPGVFSCANFTVRQCALVADKCDLMLSVSSGITVAASCWRNAESMPILQFCGSDVCSTKILSTGHFELVTHDEKPFEQAKKEFYSRLIELLKTYQ